MSMTMPPSEEADERGLEGQSHLLRIPPELRLAIYEFALLDSPCVTVGHAEVAGQHHAVVSAATFETRKDAMEDHDD